MLLTYIKKTIDNHFDPDGIQPIQGLRTALAGVLSIIFYHYNDWEQNYWVLLSSTIILQAYLGNNNKQKFISIILTGTFSAVGTFIVSLLGPHIYLQAAFLFFVTFICLYANVFTIDIGNAAYFINLFCITAAGLPINNEGSIERCICILLGAAIALSTYIFLWPDRLTSTICWVIADNFLRLSDFNRALSDPQINEKLLAIRRNRIMRGLQQARKLIHISDKSAEDIIKETEHLYEILISLNQLKNYISEQKILRVLDKELAILSRRISWLLKSVARNAHPGGKLPDIKKFILSIRTFEKFYQRYLSRLDQEQLMAFAIYIDNIHKLEKTLVYLLAMLKQRYQLI